MTKRPSKPDRPAAARRLERAMRTTTELADAVESPEARRLLRELRGACWQQLTADED